jgi:hypothetical protein
MVNDIAAALRIERVTLGTDSLQLTLANGSEHPQPYRLHSVLEKATSAQRAQWVLVDGGCGISWPALAQPDEVGLINTCDLAWEASYDAAMASLKDAGWKLEALPSREQDLCALWRLEADMNNGGFLQFFGNWGEANCRIALEALRKIGAHQALAIVQRQRDIIQRLEHDPRLQSMQDIYRLLTEAESEELDALDHAFWAYPDRLAPLGLACYGLAGNVPPGSMRVEPIERP